MTSLFLCVLYCETIDAMHRLYVKIFLWILEFYQKKKNFANLSKIWLQNQIYPIRISILISVKMICRINTILWDEFDSSMRKWDGRHIKTNPCDAGEAQLVIYNIRKFKISIVNMHLYETFTFTFNPILKQDSQYFPLSYFLLSAYRSQIPHSPIGLELMM